MVWEAISKNRKGVSSGIQTPRSRSKKLGCASFFQPTSRGLDILMKPQAAQAHASRKRGIYKLFMVLEPGRDLRERPVLGYKRPLTIWDFVWGIKYRRFRTWDKTLFQHFFSEMNKTNLPLASLCVFWAYFIVLGFLCHDLLYLTLPYLTLPYLTVTTFIRRSQGTTLF